MPQPRRPQILNTADACQGLAFRLTLHYRGANGAMEQIPIPARDHLESIEVEEGGGPCWRGSVTLFDQIGGVVESLIIAAGAVQYVSLRWGWITKDLTMDDYPEYVGQVVRFSMEFASEGMRFTLDLVNAAGIRDLMQAKVRGWPKGKLVCHSTRKDTDGSLPIVQGLAAEEKNQWTVSGGTVEDMDWRMTREFQANGESDARILEAVAREVTGANGKEVLAYIDVNGTCHFRCQSEKPTGAIIPHYRVLRDHFGDVMRFTPSDQTLLQMLYGGGEALYAAADGLTGDVIQIPTTVTDGPKGSPLVTPTDSAYVRATDPMRQRLIHLAEADPDAFRRRVATMYDVLRSRMITAALEVRGNHALRILGEVSIDVTLPSGLLHYTSGVYFIRRLRHTISSGGWTTSAEVTKYGVRPLPGGVQAQNKHDPQIDADAKQEAVQGRSGPATRALQARGTEDRTVQKGSA